MRFVQGIATMLAVTASLSIMSAQDKGGKKQGPPPMMTLKVPDFADGGRIPERFTCAASPTSPSPAVSWSGAPGGTESFVFIVHDPDPVINGSINDALHWAIFDIPATYKGLPEGVKSADPVDGAKQINNVTGRAGFFGPCPPVGHGDHHYMLEIYALNAKLGLPASASRAELLSAMDGKVLSKSVYIGIFGRK